MDDLSKIRQLARATYESGGNVMQVLSQIEGLSRTTALEIAYSLQAGTYTAIAETEAQIAYYREVRSILDQLVHASGVWLDFGVGEGTFWKYGPDYAQLYGIDVSEARLAWAAQNIGSDRFLPIRGDGFALPFRDKAIDVGLTMHALEPNTDSDVARILLELSRTCRLLVLFEPNYKAAHSAMRQRMQHHGYARNIWAAAESLPGHSVMDTFQLQSPVNPDNATSCIVLVS